MQMECKAVLRGTASAPRWHEWPLNLGEQVGKKVSPDQPAEILRTANGRYLRNDTLNAPVDGGDDQDMAAAVARTPDTNALGVGRG
jgi:hypothetical protein